MTNDAPNDLKAELQRLYADSSRHSMYQHVPDFVSTELDYTESIDEGWRGDRARLAFLLETRVPEKGETWVDFGANTGFFSLSLAHDHPHTSFVAIEANANHARFIERIAQHFGMRNVEVIRRAVGLRELGTLPHADCLLHLNVLHHAGHDFDADLVPDKRRFASYAQDYFARLADRADTLLFQLGFNWQGDVHRGLFPNGTKREVIDFVTRATGAHWRIARVGVAERPAGGIRYADVDAANVERDDALGEFLNRPLFILHTR